MSDLALVTRDGVSEMRVVYRMWSSEYPSPVIDVNSRIKKGTTVVEGFRNLQNLSVPVKCEIRNGLYHPWSESKNSAIVYVTVAPHSMYVVAKTNSALDLQKKMQKGTIISEVIYLSEGFCSAVIRSNDPKIGSVAQPNIGFECSALDNTENFTKISNENPGQSFRDSTEQWIYVACQNGGEAYVKDTTMLTAQGVQEGKVTGYGSVGPAPKN